MNSILSNILQRFEGPIITTVAQRLGVDPATATRLVSVAVPVIVAVLAHRGSATGDNAQLGPNAGSIAQGISQATGISQPQAEQLTSMLTPMVLEHLGKQQVSPQQAAGEHAKQLAPALEGGDHTSIVSAIHNLAKGFQAGAPFGRLL